MAMRRTRPAEIFDLGPLGPDLKNARTTAIVKSKAFEAVRLIVHAGVDIKTHSVEGPITLHCLEGRAQLSLPDKVVELSGGQWLYLEGGVPHAIKGIEDTSLLLTILFSHTVNVQDRAAGEAGAKRNQVTDGSLSSTEKLNSLLDEGLMSTFPASDPVSISNPSTGVGITRRDNVDKRDP
jgi:quercetin dioxygenase-like cupin family protein